jgi:hypothetical protein
MHVGESRIGAECPVCSAIVPSVSVEVCDAARGVIGASSFSLLPHCRRDFVDPETKARVAAEQARAEAKAIKTAKREAALKAKAAAKATAKAAAAAAAADEASAAEKEESAPGSPPGTSGSKQAKKKKKTKKGKGVGSGRTLSSQGSAQSAQSARSSSRGSGGGGQQQQRRARGLGGPAAASASAVSVTSSRSSVGSSSATGSQGSSIRRKKKKSAASSQGSVGGSRQGSATGSRQGSPAGSRQGSPAGLSAATKKGTQKGKKKKKKKKKEGEGGMDEFDIAVLAGPSWLDEGYGLEDELNWLETAFWQPLVAPDGPFEGEEVGAVYLRLNGCALREKRQYGGTEVTWVPKHGQDTLGQASAPHVPPESDGYAAKQARQRSLAADSRSGRSMELAGTDLIPAMIAEGWIDAAFAASRGHIQPSGHSPGLAGQKQKRGSLLYSTALRDGDNGFALPGTPLWDTVPDTAVRGECRTVQHSGADQIATAVATLDIGQFEGGSLTVGHGSCVHSLHIAPASVIVADEGVDAVAGDVFRLILSMSIRSYDGRASTAATLECLDPKVQLAGCIVEVSARAVKVNGNARPKSTDGAGAASTTTCADIVSALFDNGRVRAHVPHCHAGPASRLRLWHERVTVPGWGELGRGPELQAENVDSPELSSGFVECVLPRPGRYVVGRAAVDPKARRGGATGDLDRVFLIPRHGTVLAQLNQTKVLHFELHPFPSLPLDPGLDNQSQPAAEGTNGADDSNGSSPPEPPERERVAGGPFVVERGQTLAVELQPMVSTEEAAAQGLRRELTPLKKSSALRKRAKLAGLGDEELRAAEVGGAAAVVDAIVAASMRADSDAREAEKAHRRLALQEEEERRKQAVCIESLPTARSAQIADGSPASAGDEGVDAARASEDSVVQPPAQSAVADIATADLHSEAPTDALEQSPANVQMPVTKLDTLPIGAELKEIGSKAVEWSGQPRVELRLATRLEVDIDTLTLGRMPSLPARVVAHFNVPAAPEPLATMPAGLSGAALVLVAPPPARVPSQPAECTVEYTEDGRPWPRMFAGDCLAIHLGEMGKGDTAEAVAAAAAAAGAAHQAATALQRVWRGRQQRRALLRSLFAQYDFDGSGTLEREEVAGLLKKLGALEEHAVLDATMAAMCADEDAADDVMKGMEIPSVTVQEFEAWWIARTERIRLASAASLKSWNPRRLSRKLSRRLSSTSPVRGGVTDDAKGCWPWRRRNSDRVTAYSAP